MRAARIHTFGPPEAIVLDEVARPVPGAGEVLVRVLAAGVGPWDAWVRAGKSALAQTLPLTLGSDIAGTIEALGAGVAGLAVGDAVFGVSNAQFTGGYAEYSAAAAGMLARKPDRLGFVEAASMPVIAVTAWQMLFDQTALRAGQSVLVHGAAGNVGRFVVQLARRARLHVIATAAAADGDQLRRLGAAQVIDYRATRFEQVAPPVDAVLDLVGGEVQERSFAILKPGGILVSAVAPPDQGRAGECGVRASFFLVSVGTATLATLADLVDAGELETAIGRVLPLAEVRTAHRMLDGAVPRAAGKIVLDLA